MRPIDADALAEKLDNINPVDYGAMSSYETHNGARDALSDAVMLVNDAPILSLNTLRDAIYQDAVAHGLWEDTERLCEEAAMESGYEGRDRMYYRRVEAAMAVFDEAEEMLIAAEDEQRDETREELADVIIMALSAAGYLGIDIDAEVRRKMEINKGRSWKHEGE